MSITTAEKKKFLLKGAEQVEEGLPGWYGTFADMMTLLFAFFVLLAAISTIDPVKYEEMADSMGKSVGKKIKVDNQAMSLSEIKEVTQKMVDEMEKDPQTGEKPVEVTTGPKGVTIAISSDISFKSGSAITKPKILDILKKLVPQIKSSYFQIAVEGHTDNQDPSGKIAERYPTNWELSSARASSVVRLITKLGVNSTRLQAVGFADNVPRDRSTMELITPGLIKKYNSTEIERGHNRRVDITFLAPHGVPSGKNSSEAENKNKTVL